MKLIIEIDVRVTKEISGVYESVRLEDKFVVTEKTFENVVNILSKFSDLKKELIK